MLRGMDRIPLLSLLLYVWRVEGKFLDGAHEARELGTAVQEAGFIDEPMLMRRATVLDGLAEMRRDDLRLLRHHPSRWGRLCIAAALFLFRVARALR